MSSLVIDAGTCDQLLAHVDSSCGGEAGFGRKSQVRDDTIIYDQCTTEVHGVEFDRS